MLRRLARLVEEEIELLVLALDADRERRPSDLGFGGSPPRSGRELGALDGAVDDAEQLEVRQEAQPAGALVAHPVAEGRHPLPSGRSGRVVAGVGARGALAGELGDALLAVAGFVGRARADVRLGLDRLGGERVRGPGLAGRAGRGVPAPLARVRAASGGGGRP